MSMRDQGDYETAAKLAYVTEAAQPAIGVFVLQFGAARMLVHPDWAVTPAANDKVEAGR